MYDSRFELTTALGQSERKGIEVQYFVGVDVGGTTSSIVIGDADRRLLVLPPQFATQASKPPKFTVEAIVAQTMSSIQQLGLDTANLTSVGLATPGPSTLEGVLLRSPNLNPEYWDRFPIREELEKGFAANGLPIRVHYIGDGQAAALGEFEVRTGRVDVGEVLKIKIQQQSINSLLMLIVGTGLGGGEVRDGNVVRGSQGRAGHVGHVLLPEFAFRYPHDRQLTVGNATCAVESAVSLTALAHQLEYRLTLKQWQDHPFNSDDGSTRDKAKQLRGMATNGDELALQLFDDQARALGIALLSANYIGDYDLLVVGGGVCDLAPEVKDRYRGIVEESYRQYALDGFRNLESVAFSVCGDEAPVIGAMSHAIAETIGCED